MSLETLLERHHQAVGKECDEDVCLDPVFKLMMKSLVSGLENLVSVRNIGAATKKKGTKVSRPDTISFAFLLSIWGPNSRVPRRLFRSFAVHPCDDPP
jgi:hypothetical protein